MNTSTSTESKPGGAAAKPVNPEQRERFDWRLDRVGDPVLVATHRRSGTHLLIDLIRGQFPECRSWKFPGEDTNRLYLPMGGLARGRMPWTTARRIIARPKRPILKTHSLPTFDLQEGQLDDLVNWIWKRGTIVCSMRDCRAVMASLYAYMRAWDSSAHTTPGNFLRQTEQLPEHTLPEWEGLSRPAQWAQHVRAWLKQERALMIRYEDVINKPREVITALGQHLGLQPAFQEPLVPAKFDKSMPARIKRRLQWRPASTAIISRRAPGVHHSWRKLFTAEDLDFIWQEAGDVMTEQGYTREGD